MNHPFRYAAIAIIAMVGLTACGSTATPIPQGQAPVVATDTPTAEAPAATEAAPAAVTTCDAAKEALLTGSPTSIDAAMRALKADKTADATAREYADYYTGRDKDNKDLKEMDKGLINMACA